MASPSRDAIETYISITGASETLAVQKLEEYGGDLSEAVNAHFNGGDIQRTNPQPPAIPQHNYVPSNNENQLGSGIAKVLSAARSFKPSLLLDPNYRRDMYSRFTAAGSSLLSPSTASTSVPAQRPEQLHPVGPSHDSWDADFTPTGHSTLQSDVEVEDEMVQAAIRASILDAEASANAGLSERQSYQEDAELAHALEFSLKTAEQERAVREQQTKHDYHPALEFDRRSKPGSSSNENEAQYFDDEQQLRRKSNRGAGSHHQHYEGASHSEEELVEEHMLETASDSSLNASQQQSGQGKRVTPKALPIHRPASPSYSASRLLKEQQDKDYEMSLFMDKQKEVKSCRKMLDEMKLERTLSAKKASLSWEPALDDENAVTILVRMPDGIRAGRRFLKSDKLQLLFDFIDIRKELKPGTYRVVRSYPRQVFTINESSSSLSELGLINKQETLFLETIAT